MPRNPVINRRNVTHLNQRSLSCSDEALGMVKRLAAALHLSQGSVVDTALWTFVQRHPTEIVELLHLHGHLTDDEFAKVEPLAQQLAQKTDTTPVNATPQDGAGTR